MKLLGASDYRVMPWKNGSGTTTELFAAGSAPDGFDWRVSIATVASDGPFSRFEGCDRHIACIEGEGFDLRGGPAGEIAVLPDLVPRSFSGDWHIFGRLRSGACRDFNLIARRDLYQSSLTLHRFSGGLRIADPVAWRFVYVLDGTADANGASLAAGSGLLLEPGEAPALTGHACVIVARVAPRSGS
jgi:environmental stress-induced protein Ves